MKTIAIIPAYNEVLRVGDVVRGAVAHVDQVVVIDDGSKDGTADAARNAGALVVSHPMNCGVGASCRPRSTGRGCGYHRCRWAAQSRGYPQAAFAHNNRAGGSCDWNALPWSQKYYSDDSSHLQLSREYLHVSHNRTLCER